MAAMVEVAGGKCAQLLVHTGDRGDDNNDDSDDDLAQASIAEFINMVWWLASIWI